MKIFFSLVLFFFFLSSQAQDQAVAGQFLSKAETALENGNGKDFEYYMNLYGDYLLIEDITPAQLTTEQRIEYALLLYQAVTYDLDLSPKIVQLTQEFLLYDMLDIPETQFLFAWIAESGKTGEVNLEEAIHYYEMAALNDVDIAMVRLGRIFYEDEYGQRDYKRAKQWFEQAEAKENADAMLYLAMMYYEGKGVRENENTGDIYVRKACEFGNEDACILAGVLPNISYADDYKLGESFTFYFDKDWKPVKRFASIYKRTVTVERLEEDGPLKVFEIVDFYPNGTVQAILSTPSYELDCGDFPPNCGIDLGVAGFFRENETLESKYFFSNGELVSEIHYDVHGNEIK